ncbi:MAG: sigma-70 family RNA polymerase sigma factor [Clostridia bacterium]|nr:sigma-70 family RNA polymerase sigma factor [Clostridia bacterium]
MEDYKIVDLYWERKERAIAETEKKYGKMLHSLSYSLLSSHEDAEECVNDTYLGAWNAMPSARPMYLGPFLSKITRRLSIDRWRRDHREKRGGVLEMVEELTDCIPDSSTPAEEFERGRLRGEINEFLRTLTEEKRVIFVRRYFYAQPVTLIAKEIGVSEAKVKVVLHRLREQLKLRLEACDLL